MTIQNVSNNILKRYKSLAGITLNSVGLYGHASEIDAAFNHLDRPVIIRNLNWLKWFFNPIKSVKGLHSWGDSSQLTQRIQKDRNAVTVPTRRLNLKSLRCIGSATQNACSLEELVYFARGVVEQRGAELRTLFILPESEEQYTVEVRRSVSGEKTVYGKKNFLRFVLPAKRIHRGQLTLGNTNTEFCNINKGTRQTTLNIDAKISNNNVHFFGASEIFGSGLVDAETIPSKFCSLPENTKYQAINHGIGGVTFMDIVQRLTKCPFLEGDKVILAIPLHKGLQLADIIVKCREEEMFDYSHVNADGAHIVAKEILKKIDCAKRYVKGNSIGVERAKTLVGEYSKIIKEIEARFEQQNDIAEDLAYFRHAKRRIGKTAGLVFGSVAVNCNPMTKGHLHLIEYAMEQVDHLFILVIEEDKSAVSFRDRFQIVSDVCKRFPNVTVLRGGKYVCTEYIAPEYFVKTDLNARGVDFSLESYYFGKYIAPALGVSRIFLGEEPTCNITQQYNLHMLEEMPNFGIELTIIPRITTDKGALISASAVRKMIETENWEGLSDFLPHEALMHVMKPDFRMKSHGQKRL